MSRRTFLKAKSMNHPRVSLAPSESCARPPLDRLQLIYDFIAQLRVLPSNGYSKERVLLYFIEAIK